MWAVAAALGAAVVGAVVTSAMAPDAPGADPAVGQAASANAQVAADTLAFNRQVYEDNKPRQAATDALAQSVVASQIDISKENHWQATDQWNRFKTIFAPVEERMVQDATSIDSEGELERASGEASAGVQSQYTNATAQRQRAQAAMGVNPNSGKALAADSEGQLGLAASKAAASNNARLVARDRGIALRAGAANFGRNMPNTASNAYGVAVQSGNSAMNNSVAGINAANSSAALMNQGAGVAINGNSSAGNLLNSQYGNQLSSWNAQQQANSTSSAGYGQLIGQIGASYFK